MQKNEICALEEKADRKSAIEYIEEKAHLLLESIHRFGRTLWGEVCFLSTGLQTLRGRTVRVCIVLLESRNGEKGEKSKKGVQKSEQRGTYLRA